VNVNPPLPLVVKPKTPRQEAEEFLLGSLHECATAVSALSTALERAIAQINASQGHTQGCLQADFQNLQSVYNRMCRQESGLEMHQGAASSFRRPLKRMNSEKRGRLIRSDAFSGQVIETLPSTTPISRTDSPNVEPEAQQEHVFGKSWSAATFPPAPSLETLRPS